MVNSYFWILIAKSALQYCSFINNPTVVKDFSQDKINDSYNQIYSYLLSDLGTVQIKTTFLSSLGNPKFSPKFNNYIDDFYSINRIFTQLL